MGEKKHRGLHQLHSDRSGPWCGGAGGHMGAQERPETKVEKVGRRGKN